MADVKAKVLPVYFVADESYSMKDDIDKLNIGLDSLLDALNLQPFTAAKSRVSVIGFSAEPQCYLPLSDLRGVAQMPRLSAKTVTSYSRVFRFLRQSIPADVAALTKEGYEVHRPAVFFLTDGQPTDADGDFVDDSEWEQPLADLQGGFTEHPNILAFGIGTSRAATISRVATDPRFAFKAAAETDTGSAIAEFIDVLTHSIVNFVQGAAEGRSELVVEPPKGFISIPVDVVGKPT
jgi:uncharacterized protein YegL